MKQLMTGLIVAAFMLGASSLVGTASAEPVKLTKKQMASITAGTISPGGNPGGQPSGCSNNPNCTPATNPAGKAPPGQNR
jgi:hypothetical protein